MVNNSVVYITNGKVFVRQKEDGQFKMTENQNEASFFKKKRAENIISHNINAKKHGTGFYLRDASTINNTKSPSPVPIPTVEKEIVTVKATVPAPAVKKTADKKTSDEKKKNKDLLSKIWISRMRAANSIVSDAIHRKDELISMLQKSDLSICDIEHCIELQDDMNASDGYIMYRMMRSELRKRREIKNELELVSEIVRKGNSVFEDVDVMEDHLVNKRYNPRVLNQLFS